LSDGVRAADTAPPEAILIRRHRRWFVPLLSLAFLFAQLGMVVHASTHLKPDPDKAAAQFCGQCLTSAPLQNMVGGGAIVLPTIAILHDHAIDTAIRADAPRGAFTAFRSRAPPRTF
jgi:hypothetical protein